MLCCFDKRTPESRPHKRFCRHCVLYWRLSKLKHSHTCRQTTGRTHRMILLSAKLCYYFNVSVGRQRADYLSGFRLMSKAVRVACRASVFYTLGQWASHLLPSVCRDLRGSKVWPVSPAPTAPLWVAHFCVVQSKRRPAGLNIDHLLGFISQGHPGKEGPPGEKGMTVSRACHTLSLKLNLVDDQMCPWRWGLI